MARTKNKISYGTTRDRLLAVGMQLIRANSFKGVGINDVLKASNAPRGSFYHYFESKEVFGLEVSKYYHAQQLDDAKQILNTDNMQPIERLRNFFLSAQEEFTERGFADGCLMCNLSTELGDTNPSFQVSLSEQWAELAAEISKCLAQLDLSEIGLETLSNQEAADWLLNAWGGALTRMKAERTAAPLKLFYKVFFEIKE